MAPLVTLLALAIPLPAQAQASPTSNPGFVRIDALDADAVDDLRLAWAHELGFRGSAQGAPAVAGSKLYVSTDEGLTALDARTGEVVWAYVDQPAEPVPAALRQAPRSRPVPYGELVIASLATRPVVAAFDRETGEVVWEHDVGDGGYAVGLTTNPTLAGDVVIVGPTGADLAPTPGRLVAIRADDGQRAWTFDLVPVREDDPARESWDPVPPGRASGVGGGSAWNAGTYDPITGTVLFGTGQPVPTDRIDPRRYEESAASADLYTSSFVALDATDGSLRWFHQVVPGDEWEYDQHTVPIVTDLHVDGQPHRVALLATTTGFVVLVDVRTGALLAHHEMVPFSNVHLGYDAEGRPIIDEGQRRSDAETIVRVCPGGRWASVAPGAYSPRSGLLYRPNEWGCVRQGAASAPDAWQPGGRAHWLHSQPRSDDDFFERWGALSAIDPRDGTVAWEFATPYRHDAGVLATSTGLVVSAFADRVVRIFDADDGRVLWRYVLPSHSDGTPIAYEIDGRPYLAVLAGRDVGAPALPASGLPLSITGPASLFVFSVP
jgi:PQQ-dependent dehydrogenase (methanol/ethanol family)